MQNPYAIVKDSSMWQNSSDFSAVNKRDTNIRIGVVKKVYEDEENGDVRYIVEVRDKNDKIVSACRLMRRWGGVHNYEDTILRGYTSTDAGDLVEDLSTRAGDIVIVAYLNGDPRQGVILGGLTHAARKMDVTSKDGPQYVSEFNGLKQEINKDGEYIVTFQGMPVNIALLETPPTLDIPAPIYDPSTSGSYFTFEKDGSFEVNDAAVVMPQSIRIDKTDGSIAISAGSAELKMEKLAQEVTLTCNKTTIESQLSIKMSTIEFSVEATASIKLKALQVAIGSDGVELLDQIIQAISKIGEVVPISPVGPCSPLMGTPQWIAVELIKAKIQSIKGSL